MEEKAQDLRVASTQELKNLIKALGDAGLLVSMVVQDGFTADDVLQLVRLVQSGSTVLKELNVLLPSYKELDDAARDELLKFVEATISVPANKTVEQALETVLKVAIVASKLFKLLGLK